MPKEKSPGGYEYNSPYKSAKTASGALRDFFDVILPSERLTVSEVASRLGMDRISLSYWKSGKRCPSVLTFEEALSAIGYEIQIVKRKCDENPRIDSADVDNLLGDIRDLLYRRILVSED